MQDFRGNNYEVGDTVLYPRMSGRSCEMQEATVVQIKEVQDDRWVPNLYFDETAPADPVNNPRRVIETFTNYKVQVMPTRSSRDFYRTGLTQWAQDRGETVKPVWISIVDNIARVS